MLPSSPRSRLLNACSSTKFARALLRAACALLVPTASNGSYRKHLPTPLSLSLEGQEGDIRF